MRQGWPCTSLTTVERPRGFVGLYWPEPGYSPMPPPCGELVPQQLVLLLELLRLVVFGGPPDVGLGADRLQLGLQHACRNRVSGRPSGGLLERPGQTQRPQLSNTLGRVYRWRGSTVWQCLAPGCGRATVLST